MQRRFQKSGPMDLTFRFHSMGCPCEITFLSSEADLWSQIRPSVLDEMERLDQTYSHFRPNSDLSLANEAARSRRPYTLSPEFLWLLDTAAQAYELSHHRFDITVGPLTRLWRDARELPQPDRLKQSLDSVGFSKVSWSAQGLSFSKPGMEIEFGGLVKEYAVDRLATICREGGLSGGYVSLGGDMMVFGPQEDGSPWRIGITRPDTSEAIATLFVQQAAIATSGDYARFVEIDGARYSHLIDPVSGFPVTGLASVTVAADSCLEAGIHSTSALLNGQAAQACLTDWDCSYAVVTREGAVMGPLIGEPAAQAVPLRN